MANRQSWNSRYVFFKKEVEEICPFCRAEKLMHYSWYDLTDNSAHYRACLEEECNYDERISNLEEVCSVCGYEEKDQEFPAGSMVIKISCSKVEQPVNNTG